MIVRGPFNVTWNPQTGAVTVNDVEELDLEHEIDREEFNTIGGRTIELDGNFRAGATLTLLATSIADLSPLLPQHAVANGETMSTGETVSDADGAIDLAPLSCTVDSVYGNLDIVSCGNPGQVIRLVNARTSFEAVEISEKLLKVMIRFIGEASADEATLQFFKEGTLSEVS